MPRKPKKNHIKPPLEQARGLPQRAPQTEKNTLTQRVGSIRRKTARAEQRAAIKILLSAAGGQSTTATGSPGNPASATTGGQARGGGFRHITRITTRGNGRGHDAIATVT